MQLNSWRNIVRIVVVVLCLVPAVFSADIGGEVSGFLTAEDSPFFVTSTLVLEKDKALVIDAGVEIQFAKGTGLDVRGGSIAIVGNDNQHVVLHGKDGFSWNGISVTGDKRAFLQNVDIVDAEVGLDVQNGSAELDRVNFENTATFGLYAKKAKVDVRWCSFKKIHGIALWADADAYVDAESVELLKNNVGVFAGVKSRLNMQTSKIHDNEYGFVNAADNEVNIENVLFVQNNVESVEDKGGAKRVLANLNDAPENPFAEEFSIDASLFENENKDNSWYVYGNVDASMGYHSVWMKRNTTVQDYVSADDTVKAGKKYVNYFQTPGLYGELNAYLMMERADGKSVEFSANLLSDSWDYFDARSVSAIYTDKMQRLTLGDFYLTSGETYLAGINVFGGMYDVNLFRGPAGKPMFVASVFGGESQKPKVLGERNEDVYNDYIKDGEVEPQKMVLGGKILWNVNPHFNGTMGFIGDKDYLEDPFLRDASGKNANTSSPVISSKTFFAEGNWILAPKNFEVNAQVAIGAADTANAAMQRAINQVFENSGIDVSNFSKLRQLMNHPNLVNSLTNQELQDFFGDNLVLSPQLLRERLRNLLEEAKTVLKSYDSKELHSANLENWSGQNFALMSSILWKSANTSISGHVKYVGANYYSAGSPDLLQNSRELYGNLEQKIKEFWMLNFAYRLNVENAAHGSAYNVFGLAEGEKVGLIPGADDKWLEKHEQDENRTLYEHDGVIRNSFKIGDKIDLTVGYNLNYRTRSTSQRLYANYFPSSGVYSDPWFDAQEGKPFIEVQDEDGSNNLKVDSARWAQYYALKGEDFLASQFEERFMRHSINLDLKFNLPKNILKVSGIWTFRNDFSKFENDDLISDLDFKDETFGILGYYFHGGDYFEQRYSVSLSTTFGSLTNMIAVTPRYKVYNRDDMKDFEWSVSDDMTIPLVKNFMELRLVGSFRQEIIHYDEENERVNEMEIDVSGSGTLRIAHTKKLSSEWTIGANYDYRPDYESDEYKDAYGAVTVSYEF